MKVSVIIPCYNTADYLRGCLDSVLAQSMDDLEVICVNDCSTDGTLPLIGEYASRDPRVRLIDLPVNGGVSAARNAGIDAALGEYIYFMDSDDCLESGYIEKMVQAIEREKTDIVINSNFTFVYPDSDKRQSSSYDFFDPAGQTVPSRTVQRLFAPVVWARLYRRSFLNGNGLRFMPIKGGGEDIHFTASCDLLRDTSYIFRGPAYLYLQRPGSYMRSGSKGFYYIESFRQLRDFLVDRGIDLEGVKLFYVESLILDSEQKYDYTRDYLNEIRPLVERHPEYYNAQELFLLELVKANPDFASFISKHNPNISMSFIRYRMTHRI